MFWSIIQFRVSLFIVSFLRYQLVTHNAKAESLGAYDKAMWQTYRPEITAWVRDFLAKKRKQNKPIDKKWLRQVEKLGLIGKPRRNPWNLREWIFVLEKMKVADEFF